MKMINVPWLNAEFCKRETTSGQGYVEAFLKQWIERLARYSVLAALPTVMAAAAQEANAVEARSADGNLTELAPERNIIPRRTALAGGYDKCPGKPVPPGAYTAAAPYTDTGNTTGADDTFNAFAYYYYYWQDAHGPDQVYSFTLTAAGPNAAIEVTAANPSAYKPLIYVTANPWNGGCAVGTDNFFWYPWPDFNDARWDQSDNKISLGDAPLKRRYFLFIDSRHDDALGSGAYTVKFSDMTIASNTPGDFDGDAKADPAVFRAGNWYAYGSTAGFMSSLWGMGSDKVVTGDYDGDGKIDPAVFRNGVWWALNSAGGHSATTWGIPGDALAPADYEGDGRTDFAVIRNGVWWIWRSHDGWYSAENWWADVAVPVPADYDGDGRDDVAFVDSGVWRIFKSWGGQDHISWGLATDRPVPADYDGDGRMDIAIYRDGAWWVLNSNGGHSTAQWGSSTDIPVPADYDGDGKADIAIVRDGVWWILKSTGGHTSIHWGTGTDVPINRTVRN
jgi:hypothetical protein